MSRIYFNCVPFDKGDVTLALESGVDGVIVPREHMEQVAEWMHQAIQNRKDEKKLGQLHQEVIAFCAQFALPSDRK